VLVSGSLATTRYLIAQGGFNFESFGINAFGVNINNNAHATLKDGKITTHGDGTRGIMAFLISQALPLIAERVQIETYGINANGIELHQGSSSLCQ